MTGPDTPGGGRTNGDLIIRSQITKPPGWLEALLAYAEWNNLKIALIVLSLGIAIFHAGDSHIFGCIAFCNYWKTWKHLAWNALLLLNSSAMCTLVNQLDDFHSELHVVYSEFVLLCFLVKCYAWKCDCISWVRTHQWSLVENLWPQPNQLNFNFEV